MIEKNRLLNFDSIIYQNSDWFKFSMDSVLLVNFVTLNLSVKKIMDLATGNAPIPLLLTYKTKADIDCIELQKCVYDLGVRSIIDNGFGNQIKIVNGDVRNIKEYFDSGIYDVVLCNPPYFKTNNEDFVNDNDVKKLARHEITLNIDSVLNAAKYLLKTGGNFAMVHRSDRFVEILEKMRINGIEPKKVQFIYPKQGKNSDLFLIEGKLNGKSGGLKILPPLIIHDVDGSYTEEVREMFGNSD